MTKAAKKVSAVLAAAMLSFGAFSLPALAEEIPVELAGPDKATVSEEVDRTDNKDDSIGTQFYMYIPPDIVGEDYPQMGDEGLPIELFLAGAVVSGVAYLGMTAYSNSDKRNFA